MTTTRFFQSTDSGAPQLTGQSGAIVSILRACLVGNSGVAYGNGENQKIAAGWTELFTGTAVKGVFQNSIAVGASGMCVRILDDGSLASGGKEAQMLVFAAMSDANTGTNQMPSAAQAANGIILRKSTTADSSPRAWTLAADEKGFVLTIIANPSQPTETNITIASDFDSEIPGDAYNYLCTGRTNVNDPSSVQDMVINSQDLSSTNSGTFVARSYTQTGGPIAAGFLAFGCSGKIGAPLGGMADPAIGTNNRYFTPIFISGEKNIRGRLRGVIASLNNVSGTITAPQTLANISGRPSGSTLYAFPMYGPAVWFIEVGTSWDNP